MKHTIFRKICIVLALVAVSPLALASITSSTLAYLTDSDSIANGFTFRRLGRERTVRLSYYYQDSNGNFSQITGNNYQNVRMQFRENELICANNQNTRFVTPPNGFEVSYITHRTGNNGAQTRVNAGDCFVMPANDDIYVNVYFAPVTYSITYDFNGYNQSDITFSSTPLQSTYTVYDMIKVPYDDSVVDPANTIWDFFYYLRNCLGDNRPIRCVADVPTASVANNTLQGWNDQNGVLHTYANSGTNNSWVTEITLTGNQSGANVYDTFAMRTSGNLVLTASWANAVPNNNVNNNNSFMMLPEAQLVPGITETSEEQNDEDQIDEEIVKDATSVEAADTDEEKVEELRKNEDATE